MRGLRKPRLWALALLCASAALALPASAHATSPWWGIDAGSRPSNLQVAPDQTEVQEVKATALGGNFGAAVEVGGEVIGCLGIGLGAILCEPETGFEAAESAADLEEMLEGPYGEDVEVTGGPVGTPFLVTTPGRWVAPLKLTPIVFFEAQLGFASVTPVSEGSGRLFITATNLGDAPLDATSTPLTITYSLPAGVSPYSFEAFAGTQGNAGPVECVIEGAGPLTCVFEGELPSYEAIEVEVAVALAPGVSSGEAGEVTISGGDGPAKSVAQTLRVSGEEVGFGIESLSMRAEEEGGETASQAGSHPFQVSQSLVFNSGKLIGSDRRNTVVEQPAMLRNVRVKLPPGLIGNPSPIPTCSFKQFTTQSSFVNECQPETAVGAASVTIIEAGNLGFTRVAVPIFNLEPAYGEPARFGFMAAGVPVTIGTELRGGEAYAIGANVLDASQLATVLASTVSIWGNPGDPAHDSSRGWGCLYFTHPYPCQRPAGLSEAAFLRMPVSCDRPLTYGIEVEPWNAPLGSQIDAATDQSPPLSGCDLLPFDPSIASTPTSKLTSTPSGLDFELTMPNSGLDNPKGRAEAQPKRVEVDLPEGVSVNPSEAEGLATCSEAQYARETVSSKPGEGCPEASKIGSVLAHTPLLDEPIEGSLYIAAPHANPFDSLLALYMVARVPQRGIVVKQAGVVKPDPVTGQLRTIFDELPQVPYSDFKLHFREGGRAPLVTPPACGTYQTLAKFLPYSAANLEDPSPEEIVERTSPFTIERGPDGGACPTGGLPPFHPGLIAGSTNNAAGHFSPFNVRLFRSDAEQEITHFSIKLPPGVTGKLAGVPYCPEAAIEAAKARTGPHGGREELNSPSCPAASEVGHTLAGAGVGSILTYVPGKVYLAGPYHGSKLSIVAVTAAVAGPFDLGTVVVREALQINPETAEVFVDATGSDPIPHIIQGIPVHLRDIRAYVDRPEFALNPTDCTPTSTASTVLGAGLDFVSEADDNPVTVATRYQAADCAALPFKPKLTMRLRGGTRRGAHPAFSAHLQMNGIGEAGIAYAQVTLPKSEFIENAHFKTICTRVQFKAGAGNGAECPSGSIYGHAKAVTPILAEPLEGPVFLRSSEHQLPDLVVALHNSQVDFNLVGRVDSVKGGGLRSSFESSPDAPVSSFDLEMDGGAKGLFVNSTNLCKRTYRAKALFNGQNGKRYESKPVLRAKCPKKHKRHKGHRRARSAHIETGARR